MSNLKALALHLEFDVKAVRKAIAQLTGEVLSDEEINENFFDREPLKLDVQQFLGAEADQICMAFCALLYADAIGKLQPAKSAWQQKLEEIQSRNNP